MRGRSRSSLHTGCNRVWTERNGKSRNRSRTRFTGGSGHPSTVGLLTGRTSPVGGLEATENTAQPFLNKCSGTGNTRPAVCQIVGYKNSGKTTLISALIPLLQQEQGCTVAVIKHDAHDFDMDHPGTDTWQHRQAGATAIAITSSTRTSWIEERGSSLDELIEAFSGYDYVLVEGFKHEPYPKIVLIRREEDLTLLHEASNLSAIAVWEPMENTVSLQEIPEIKTFGINDIRGIASFLWQQRTYFQNYNI